MVKLFKDYAKQACKCTLKFLLIIVNVIKFLPKLKNVPIFVHVAEFVLSLYYYCCCGICPCTVDLDDQTTMHFWIPKHRGHGLPNLVLIHGCGADARWQFFLQMRSLSKSFNIYMPDLLFFGKSYTKCKDRSPRLQAKCIMEGLMRGFGVKLCSIYSISYGGWVGYRMAELYPPEVEKIVIVSSGMGFTVDQMLAQLKNVKTPVQKVVVPHDPQAFRLLLKRSIHKYDLTWVPDYVFWGFIKAKEDKNRKEKEELIQHLISGEANSQLSTLSQETLLVWGNEDKCFPVEFGIQLQRLLGPKARLEVIKDTGHAVNIDAPNQLNHLIKSFVLTRS